MTTRRLFFSGVFDVACSYCGASGPDCYVDDEVEQEDAPDLAVQSWNARPTEDALRAELARKDTEIAILNNVFWSAEDTVSGWHPNLDIRERMKDHSKVVIEARARLAQARATAAAPAKDE